MVVGWWWRERKKERGLACSRLWLQVHLCVVMAGVEVSRTEDLYTIKTQENIS